MENRDQIQLIVTRIMIEPNIAPLLYRLATELPEVYRHSLNVAYLVAETCYAAVDKDINSILIYNKMDIIRGALLHDIGKLDIPNEILHKKGELNKREFAVMSKHSKIGYKKLLSIEKELNCEYSDVVKDIVLHHHENINGTGYPDKIKNISIATKLVALCDKYDAITEDRPYRPANSVFDAYKILSNGDIDDLFLLLISCDNR